MKKFFDGVFSLAHNNAMRHLTRLLCLAQVWMTTFATFFAGISPCQCVCPDGHRKLFCLGTSCGSNACCCASACCDSAQPGSCTNDEEANERCCCCCKCKAAHDKTTAHIQGRGCRRTLSRAEIVTDYRKHPSVNDGCEVRTLVEPPARMQPIPMAFPLVHSSESYRPPPPTDLIIALQHFVI